MRAFLLPLAAPGAQGSQNDPSRFGEPGSRFWNTSPKKPPQTTLQAPGGTKMIHSFCSDLREHICCLNTKSGPRSPLKRLSESREDAAVFESLFASIGGSRSPGLPKRLPSGFGETGIRFGAVFLGYIKRVSALQASLDY